MAGIQHAIQLAATPPRLPIEADVECGDDPEQRADVQEPELAMLDPRDGCRRYASPRRQVALPPASPKPDRTHRCSETLCIHRSMMRERSLSAAYRAVVDCWAPDPIGLSLGERYAEFNARNPIEFSRGERAS
jgi:hypothetical protein